MPVYQKKELSIKALTDEQKSYIDENWDKIRFVALVKGTFQNDALDGRCAESRLIKDYLGERVPVSSAHPKVPDVELTEEQKEYIENHSRNSKAFEMARILFKNNRIGPLDIEARCVYKYVKTLPSEITGQSFTDECIEEYKGLNTIKQVVDRVNECVFSTNFDYEKLNSQQRKHFESVKGFLKSPRFLHMINSYASKISRNIFESEFIRTVYDKPDLTPDELNLCINLCSNYVLQITVNRHLDMLNEKYEAVFNDPDSKISTSLSDMILAKTKEYNDCDQRQQKLINDLQGKRSERHKNKTVNTMSVATLLEAWKDETERRRMIKMAQARQDEMGAEIDRLDSMDAMKCRWLGMTKNELLLG